MRDLGEVIDKIMDIVPESEDGLLASLKDIRESVAFAPPFGMGLWWEQTGHCLQEYLEDRMEEEWAKAIRKEFMKAPDPA